MCNVKAHFYSIEQENKGQFISICNELLNFKYQWYNVTRIHC